MRTHREVEHTYAPGPDLEIPDLTVLPGVARVGPACVDELEATYFDDAALDLLRAGITLRRRTGGSDEGWHLKLPASSGRTEVQLPLGHRRTPPAELLALVAGHLRGAPVEPVATIATRREERALQAGDGTVLAELADDRVTGTPAHDGRPVAWREWELELVDGEEALLRGADELLAEAGAGASRTPRKILHVLGDRLPPPVRLRRVGPDRPAGRVLQRRLAEQVDELLRHDVEIRQGRAEGIHQARVTCRRLRGALATYRPLVDREVTDPLRDELRWLGGALGRARDATVLRQRLQTLLGQEPPALLDEAVGRRLTSTYAQRLAEARGQVEATLTSARYYALLDDLERLVADPPWTEQAGRPAREVLPARVRRDWRRLSRDVGAVDQAPDRDRALHQVRKDAKRLRYAAEALEPVWGKDAARLVKAAKTLTTHLGERQDTVMSRPDLLAMAGEAEAAGESALGWGRLHAREQDRAEQLDRELDALWADAARPRLRRWLR